MLLYVYKGVTSTDSGKTQIFYPLDLKSNFPHHLMGPTLKVSKLVHAQAYGSQVVPYPSPLSQTLHPEKLVPFRKSYNSKNDGIGATKDTEPDGKGGREGETRPSQAPLIGKNSCCWKQRPHLLLSLSRGGGNPINEQQRHRHSCRSTQEPPTRCHVLSSPSQKRNFPGAGSLGWA